MPHYWDVKRIEKEKWKKAPGIKAKKNETNAALATRDYSIDCKAPFCITVIEGYFLWWCSTHHQPLAWCENAKLRISIRYVVNKALEII